MQQQLEQVAMDPMWIIAAVVVAVACAAVGAFLWNLHLKKVPNNKLLPALGTRTATLAHTVGEDVLEAAQTVSRKVLQINFPGMQPVYWDRDDFMKDVGIISRDPANTDMIWLDTQPVKPGTGNEIKYTTQQGQPATIIRSQPGK